MKILHHTLISNLQEFVDRTFYKHIRKLMPCWVRDSQILQGQTISQNHEPKPFPYLRFLSQAPDPVQASSCNRTAFFAFDFGGGLTILLNTWL
ncbi:hypothetical protein L1887_26523 [Cichorium endivia]|nr:hypothetical protein L1887_26523 [Cichorium endivia]